MKIGGAPRALAICLAATPSLGHAEDTTDGEVIVIDSVVVVGSKRAEEALTFSGATAAVDAQALEKRPVRKVTDLEAAFTGVSANSRGSDAYANITVRGAASLDFYNPTVQVYVDGVPQDATLFGQMVPGRLDQVELLYGPQGTLYGKGAVGGVLNIVTLRPGEGPDLAFSIEGGDGRKAASASAEVELADGVWADVTLGVQDENDDLTTTLGEDVGGALSSSGQLRLRYAPDESAWDVMLSAGRMRTLSDEEYFVLDSTADDRVAAAYPSDYTLETNSFSLNASYDLGFGELTSITSFQDRDLDRTVFGFYTPETQETLTQEFRISSADAGPLGFVAGVFLQGADFNRQAYGQNVDVDTRTIAGFADLSWKATDRLTLSPGIRVDYETADVAATGYGFATDGDESWIGLSPKFGASYGLGDGVAVYGRASTGFKAGGFTRAGSIATIANSYDPERTYSAEAGVKYEAPNGAITASLGAYYNLTEDFQAYVGEVGAQYLQNVGDVVSTGVEASASLKSGDFTLTGGAAFNRSTFVDYSNPLSPTDDYDGNDTPFAPDLQLSMVADYRFALGADAALTPRIGASYQSKSFFDVENLVSQDGYTLLDAGLTWQVADGLELDLYAHNLTDQTFYEYGFLFYGTSYYQLGGGREVGLLMRKTF